MPKKETLEFLIRRYGGKYITVVDTFVRSSCLVFVVSLSIYYFKLISGISSNELRDFVICVLLCCFFLSIPRTMLFTYRTSRLVRDFLSKVKNSEYSKLSRQALWNDTINMPSKIVVNLFTAYIDTIPALIYLYVVREVILIGLLKFELAVFLCINLVAQPMYFFWWEIALRPVLLLIRTTDLLPQENIDIGQCTYLKTDIARKLKFGVISIILLCLILSGTLGYSKLREGIRAVERGLSSGFVFSNFAFQMSMIGFVTVAAVSVLIFFLSKSISTPLEVLSDGMERVSKGDMSCRVEILSNDELGRVAFGFNNMTAKLSKSYQKIQEQNVKLKEMDRLKSQFLANTSHELRTPLNGIIGLTDAVLLDCGQTMSEKSHAHLKMVKECGQSLLGLVNNLLDLTKIVSGQASYNMKHFSLRSLLDIVFPVMKGVIHNKNIELCADIEDGLPDLYGDMDKMWQVFNNLIGNAIKFTSKGLVTVRARKITVEKLECWNNNGMVEVCVEDCGIGIAKEHLERVFEEFWQVDGGVDRKYEGTGLGLYITKKIVEGHHGKIWVESELGVGSKFYLMLPTEPFEMRECLSDEKIRVEEKVSANKGAGSVELKGAAAVNDVKNISAKNIEYEVNIDPRYKTMGRGNGEKILIVDDNEINREVVKTHVEFYNYCAQEAENGEEALRKMREERFDLVVLDLMMPKMSGYDVCKAIREDKKNGDVPIIMLTAKGSTEDIVYGLNLGANDYLSKPFKKEELIARINSLLYQSKIKFQLRETITQRENTQAQLVLSEKMASLGLLISGIAHEINTPIGAIANIAEEMRSKVQPLCDGLTNLEKLNQEELHLFCSFSKDFMKEESGATLLWREERKVRKWLESSNIEGSDVVLAILSKYSILDKEKLEKYITILSKPWVMNFLDSLGTANAATKICELSAHKIIELVKALKYHVHTGLDKNFLVDINESIENTLLILHNKLKSKVDVVKNLKPLPKIYCTSEINQIWMNLLCNSYDAIVEVKDDNYKGKIWIETGEENSLLRVKITDNGVGISQENREKLFTPFFTSKEIGKGTGLGLSIVADIVKRHKGKIQVESVPNNTSFTVLLPVIKG